MPCHSVLKWPDLYYCLLLCTSPQCSDMEVKLNMLKSGILDLVVSSCKSHEIYIVSTMHCLSIVYPNPNLIYSYMKKEPLISVQPTHFSSSHFFYFYWYTFSRKSRDWGCLFVMCVAACPPGKDAVTPQESERIHQTHQESIRQWRKRKRMVCYITFSMAFSYFFLFQAMPSLLVCFYLTFNPSFSQYRYLISTQFLNCSEQAARVPVLH